MDNYKWLIANENVVNSIHEKWVIIRDGKILAVGDNLKTLIDDFRAAFPKETPFVIRVPEKELRIV